MRSFILGIVILMAVPAYAVGQQQDGSERSASGRTAVPREETAQAAPARPINRRAEPRGETTTPQPPEDPSSSPVPDHRSRPFSDRERRRSDQRDGDDRPCYRRPHTEANVVFVPYAAPVIVEREVVIEREVVDRTAGAPVIVEPPSLAQLFLDIHPPTAQVFADGYYAGIPEDFRFEHGGAVLDPGPHRIDIMARGYEPFSFDVNLMRGQSVTFRHTLTPITRAPQAALDTSVKTPSAAKKPAIFYLIPGCYLGNVPPRDANCRRRATSPALCLFSSDRTQRSSRSCAVD
jgi:hypothetical protein